MTPERDKGTGMPGRTAIALLSGGLDSTLAIKLAGRILLHHARLERGSRAVVHATRGDLIFLCELDNDLGESEASRYRL